MSFRWTKAEKRFLVYNTAERQVWPHLFMGTGGAKQCINKWCAPEDAWVYEVVLTDTGPQLERVTL